MRAEDRDPGAATGPAPAGPHRDAPDTPRDRRLRRYWDRHADSYDRAMEFAERRIFADTRAWVCGQARGDTLEVAVGTGLNLPYYPAGVALYGVEWSAPMLDVARRRARDLDIPVRLCQGDARALAFPDASFDTVVCTFSLCAIPDDRQALAEMARVLRPGGLLLLADHVPSTNWPVRALMHAVDLVAVPLHGEHLCRRPARLLRSMPFTVEHQERYKLGIIERLAARRA